MYTNPWLVALLGLLAVNVLASAVAGFGYAAVAMLLGAALLQQVQ